MMPTTICIYYNEPGGLEPKPDAIFCFSFGQIGQLGILIYLLWEYSWWGEESRAEQLLKGPIFENINKNELINSG